MIKTIYVCDKCKKENTTWLYPYPHLRIDGLSLKVKPKDHSLCHDCLTELIEIIEDFGEKD